MARLIPTGTKREDCVQTPIELAEVIVAHFKPTGKILEPCKGQGNFLKALPPKTEWCELLEGKDFFDYEGKVNWIITNPPYSKMRKFIQKAMEVSDNIVFLTTINHLWLKARLRDIDQAGFGIKEIVLCETPLTFPQSGFQIGCFHLQKGYKGNISFSKLKEAAIPPSTKVLGILAEQL
jgi:hypothetical protein